MRRSLLCSLAALALAACGPDQVPTEPDDSQALAVDFAAVAYGMTGAMPGAALPELGRLKRLPEAIALTPAQEAEITALLEDFQADHQDDIDALVELVEKLRAARQAGASRAEIAALLEQARPIRLRLAAAAAALKTAIDQVLTVEQRTWLVSRSPARCYPEIVPPLSAEQRRAIATLQEQFRDATAADRAAVDAAFQAARAAHRAGASRAEIQAILDSVNDELEALQEAGEALRTAVNAVLTEAQRNADCFGNTGPRHRG